MPNDFVPRHFAHDPEALKMLEVVKKDPSAQRDGLMLATGILLGTGNKGAAAAVLWAFQQLMPEGQS